MKIFLCLIVLSIEYYSCNGKQNNMSTGLIALVTGYTGESGKAVVKELIKNNGFKKVILVGRRQVDYTDNEYKEKTSKSNDVPRKLKDQITNALAEFAIVYDRSRETGNEPGFIHLIECIIAVHCTLLESSTEQRQVDFDKIDDHADAFRGADVHFCCLGTTRGRSGAEGFRRVDYDYIVGAGRLAKQEGCKHFHLVSSQGANENSFFLYSQVKGQAEAALTKMSFERLSIYRPAMLMVDRVEQRLLESVAQTIIRYTVQRIAPEWITTPIEVLGRAMCLNTFTKDRPNVEILDNHAIFRLSEQQSDPKPDQSKATNEL